MEGPGCITFKNVNNKLQKLSVGPFEVKIKIGNFLIIPDLSQSLSFCSSTPMFNSNAYLNTLKVF
jgi:hypothetical protein